MIALGVGAGLPVLFIDIEVDGSLLKRSQNVIGITALFFTAFVFIRVGKKYLSLKFWAANTILGVVCMLFVSGLLISLFMNIYMLLPFPAWLHLTTSVVLGFVAASLLFAEFMRNG